MIDRSMESSVYVTVRYFVPQVLNADILPHVIFIKPLIIFFQNHYVCLFVCCFMSQSTIFQFRQTSVATVNLKITLNAFLYRGLKGPPGACCNRIVRLSVRLSVSMSVTPSRLRTGAIF